MKTNYAAPVALVSSDVTVSTPEWVKVFMAWTLRSLNPIRDEFTTLSYSIEFDGSKYSVVERIDGFLPKADDFNLRSEEHTSELQSQR